MSDQPNPAPFDEPGMVTIERMSIDYSVYYGIQVPYGGGDGPPALLIAVHGYGQSCRSFMRSFTPFQMENILIVTPQAPNQFYEAESMGRPAFSWMTNYDPENALADITAYIKRLLEMVEERCHYDPNKIFLMGFSQGVGMAFHFVAAGLVKPIGLIACSGALHQNLIEKLPSLDKFPVFLLHGENDQSINIEKGREIEQALRDSEFPLDTLYHDGIHELTPDQTEAILEWVKARM